MQLFLQVDPFYDTLKLLVVDSITAVIYPSLGGQQMDGKSANHSNLSQTTLESFKFVGGNFHGLWNFCLFVGI